MREAMYYKKLDDKRVSCFLCPHHCNISEGHRGVCTVRKNKNGVLYTLNYNRLSSIALDPIEKKPLYHFYPGSYILSIGTVGCNFKCSFCQNWHIAQREAETHEVTSKDIVQIAKEQSSNIGIAYTYNEPSIWFEFVYETSKLAKENGLKNVLVSNGFIEREALLDILPYIDAMNIDVKGFTEGYYKDICKGLLEPVKGTVEIASEKCHVEITTLIVKDLNDSIEEIVEISKWLSSINKDIPLHLSRYFPNYKLSNDPTPIDTIMRAREEAQKYLNHVYVGNVREADNTTYCPKCKKAVIKRDNGIIMEGIEVGKCRYCGYELYLQYFPGKCR